MAQPSLPNSSMSSLASSVGQTGSTVTAWSGTMAGRLRSSLLPERHGNDPAVKHAVTASSRSRRWSQRLSVLLPRLALGIAILFLAVSVGLFAFRTMYNDRIYPAVVIGDVPVGGLTASQADDRISERATDLEQGTVQFSHGGQVWTPTLSELGVTVDADQSINQAQDLGRGDDAVSRLAFTGDILRDDQVVPLRMRIDQEVLGSWFDRVDRELGSPAVDAAIVIDGTSVTISPDATGTGVDRPTATRLIMGALSTLRPVQAELPTAVAEPAVRVADLESAKADLDEVFSSHVRVDLPSADKSWRIEPETFSSYLTVETSVENGKVATNLVVDEETLTQDVRSQFEGEVNTTPVDARVAWSDTDGLIALDPSSDGTVLKPNTFAQAVAGSFLGGHERIDIPVVVTKPEIDANNLQALKIDKQLARGDSNYEGGTPERDTNIEVGVGLLNGTLVKPGEEFSFNGAIGEITADKGYVEAGVVVAERVGKDIGGGICQVSTTVFRAALLSGLPITMWYPHTYRLPGYEKDGWAAGFDASILQLGDDPANWGDFRFENNTGGWLLVEAWTAYPNVIVNIYGQDSGTTVEIADEYVSDPVSDNENVEVVNADLPTGTIQQTEWPMDGFQAGFVRRVFDANGKMIVERWFETSFKGRGNVYEVSPDMEGQSPRS